MFYAASLCQICARTNHSGDLEICSGNVIEHILSVREVLNSIPTITPKNNCWFLILK
jgi:hypothetical protein